MFLKPVLYLFSATLDVTDFCVERPFTMSKVPGIKTQKIAL